MTKRDIYQEVTDQIIDALEAGCVPWVKPWDSGTLPLAMPLRSTGVHYQGINVLLLWLAQEQRGYASNHWFTYRQASNLGAQVRKGEKSISVIYYGSFEKETDSGDAEKIPFLKSYRVFNADQIDGLPEQFYSEIKEPKDFGTERDAELDAFFANIGATIIEDGREAKFIPSKDTIYMPPIKHFKTANAFYSTLAHESCHATGLKTRLDRKFGIFGSADYAREELVAEMGAAFTMSRLGAAPEIEQSAAYLGSWLEALKNDKKFIFKAASDAAKAADFLFSKQPTQQNEQQQAA